MFLQILHILLKTFQEQNGCGKKWFPHMVELALWAHNIISDLRPELLGKKPIAEPIVTPTNGGSPLPSDESNLEPPSTNGENKKIIYNCRYTLF